MGIQITIDNPGKGEWAYKGTQISASDPGVGQWLTNAGDTRIDISATSRSGLNLRARLSQFENGASVYVRFAGQDKFYSVQASVDHTTWFELTVTAESASTGFALNVDDIHSIDLDLPKGAGGTGVTDHGALTGLIDDDHPQYLNQTRADSRYYTQGEVDSELATKSDTGHGHPGVYSPTGHGHDGSDITTGTMPVERLPVGTGGTNVAAGDHDHDGDYLPQGHAGGVEHIDWSTTGAEQVHADRYSSGSGGATNTVSATPPLENLTDNVNPNLAIQQQGDATLFGRAEGAGTGRPGPLTNTQARSLLNVEDGSVAAGTAGDAHAGGDGSDHSAVAANTAGLAGLGTAASKDFGTAPGELVELDGSGYLPALDGRNLTRINPNMNFGIGVWANIGTNGETPSAGEFSADDGTAVASPPSTTSLIVHGSSIFGGSSDLLAGLQTGDRLFLGNPDAQVFHIFKVTGPVTGTNPYTIPVTYDGGSGGYDSLPYGIALVRSESTASGNTIETQQDDATVDANTAIINFEGSGITVVPEGGGKVTVQVAAGAAPVDSVFGRTGIVLPQSNDYAASQVNNDSGVTGAQVSDALDTLDTEVSAVTADYAAHAGATGDRHGTDDIDNESTANGGTGSATSALTNLNLVKAETTDARFPTAGEKDALSGTEGTPSSANKYVTSTDPRLATENGFVDAAGETTLSWDGNRTLTISPTGANFTFWAGGIERIKSAPVDFVLPASPITTGLWYLYFDPAGAAQVTDAPDIDALIDTNAFVAAVFWDDALQEAHLVMDERHGNTMSSMTHKYNHNTLGARFGDGLRIQNLAVDGNGDTDAQAQCSFEGGSIWDEDLKHSLVAHTLPGDGSIPIFYREGAAGDWKKSDTSFVVEELQGGNTYPNWNENLGASWTRTEMVGAGAGSYTLTHFFATGDILSSFIAVMGQSTHGSLAEAQAAAEMEIRSLELGQLAALTPEFVAIGTVICHIDNGHGNAVATRVVSTSEGQDYIDWRTASGGGSASAVATSHNGLTGIQGGAAGEYFHATTDQAAALAGTGTPAAGNPYVTDDDARLTDTRDPNAHEHAGEDITSGTVGFGRLPTGTGATQVAVGNHGHVSFAGSTPGFVPTSPGGTDNYLRGDGIWAPPPGIAVGHETFIQGTDPAGLALDGDLWIDDVNGGIRLRVPSAGGNPTTELLTIVMTGAPPGASWTLRESGSVVATGSAPISSQFPFGSYTLTWEDTAFAWIPPAPEGPITLSLSNPITFGPP